MPQTKSVNTFLGVSELILEIIITNPTNKKRTSLLAEDIISFNVGCDIFSYKQTGQLVMRDRFGVHLGLNDVSKTGPLEIEINLNNREFGETYIASEVESIKTDLASDDITLKIDFENKSSVLIEQAYVRCMLDEGQTVASFLQNQFQKLGLKTSSDNWIEGDMTFKQPRFFLGKLKDIVKKIITMDGKRETGNLFICYSNFDGELCYMEISDRLRQTSRDMTEIFVPSTGGLHGMGSFILPIFPAAWDYSSTDLNSLIENSPGFKFYNYQRDKKLMIPRPKREGTSSCEVLSDIPIINTQRIVQHEESNKGLDEFFIHSTGNPDEAEDINKLGNQILSRNIALNDWFNNNTFNIRLGFMDIDLTLNQNVGLKANPNDQELFNKALHGEWLVAGIKHVIEKTNIFTDLYLIRNALNG